MSAPDAPKDNSVELARIAAQEARQARRRDRREQRREERELADLRSGAQTGAMEDALGYFTTRGLDPAEYTNEIDQAIQNAMMGIAKDDPNPGSYLQNIGQDVFDEQTNLARINARSGLDDMFDDDFDQERIGNTIDDAILDAIYQEERGKGTGILDNMLARKVITDTGYASGIRDLDRQSPAAQARLTTLGDAEIARGRSNLRGVVSRGRETADTLDLGDTFNAAEYGSDVDAEFDTWLSGLNTNLRAVAPTDLFSTASLASVAGQGQGAQNTQFDPKALAGIMDTNPEDDEEEEDETPESVF